jgi:hypothetical protein
MNHDTIHRGIGQWRGASISIAALADSGRFRISLSPTLYGRAARSAADETSGCGQ